MVNQALSFMPCGSHPCSTRKRWHNSRDRTFPGRGGRAVDCAGLEIRIQDFGLNWAVLSCCIDFSWRAVLKFGQQWTEVSPNVFSGLLLRVTSSAELRSFTVRICPKNSRYRFGVSEATSFWKRGSFRSGSNIGSSRSSAGVSGMLAFSSGSSSKEELAASGLEGSVSWAKQRNAAPRLRMLAKRMRPVSLATTALQERRVITR